MAKKILVVDDEASIVTILKATLQAEGYEVVTASNGLEALQCVATQQPDLIILDVLMPEMDGFTALRRLRENEASANVPVVMLTAKDEEADILSGWLRGADLYMTKPFDPWELAANVSFIFQDNEATNDGEFLP